MNLDKTSNLGQKFAALNILIYCKLLNVIAGFIKVKVKVQSPMAKSLPVENLLPPIVGSIINYLQ